MSEKTYMLVEVEAVIEVGNSGDESHDVGRAYSLLADAMLRAAKSRMDGKLSEDIVVAREVVAYDVFADWTDWPPETPREVEDVVKDL